MHNSSTLWFVFCGNTLALHSAPDGGTSIPCGDRPPLTPVGPLHELGIFAGKRCVACEAEPPHEHALFLSDLRSTYDTLGPELYAIAGKGFQFVHWNRQSRFCPACGTATVMSSPVAKTCPHCKHEYFPTIATAILALVRKDDSALLVRGLNFRGKNYGLVAGFLEVGESLEECVHREVMEETGLTISNLQYFGSQPWPYPSGLMVGFTADYVAGDITLQLDELETGAFYTRGTLPLLPHELSLARRMIDWWRAQPL